MLSLKSNNLFSFHSITKKVSKARHRGDILEFTVKNNQHLSVVEAAFYLYVRGEDWIFDNDPTLLANYGRSSNSKSSSGGSINDEVTHTGNKQIAISLNRFIHRHPQQVIWWSFYNTSFYITSWKHAAEDKGCDMDEDIIGF